MNGLFRRRRGSCWALALALGLGIAPGVQASDPLDEHDGTEGWDQVVQPAPERKPERRQEQTDMRSEIAQWELIRVTWEQERERYMRERAAHKTMASRMRPAARVRATMEINDDNVDQVTGDDWGDAPGEQWLVPAGAVDRAIDDELSESKPAAPAPEKRPPPLPAAPPPAALAPPPEATSGGDVPSAFTQHERKEDLGGGIAPTSPTPDAPLPPTAAPEPKATPANSEDDGAKAAAEMIRKQQEEQRRKEAEEKARREAEADAGAAAAAQLLKQQAERDRKEQEALRKKAGVEVDDEGQVVDPDLQREMEDDD